ncbi:MAG: hypothetical protein COV43_00250 [Deltaproteobacteria bacterium CG11_big_fil_rev_8_21_14_0_20_42_23]|nr:MAG: hypothetical protein COV43_00250 [Deltaproteobacteria bacterium CG11_big_fil_rev_8_21_14_0_20_42_23]PJC64449.1 MAG: hypothetical protein CO021_04155 [Deltaproteobacteria bacterium CG_4_9_14_0_2_um_filter_42_21]
MAVQAFHYPRFNATQVLPHLCVGDTLKDALAFRRKTLEAIQGRRPFDLAERLNPLASLFAKMGQPGWLTLPNTLEHMDTPASFERFFATRVARPLQPVLHRALIREVSGIMPRITDGFIDFLHSTNITPKRLAAAEQAGLLSEVGANLFLRGVHRRFCFAAKSELLYRYLLGGMVGAAAGYGSKDLLKTTAIASFPTSYFVLALAITISLGLAQVQRAPKTFFHSLPPKEKKFVLAFLKAARESDMNLLPQKWFMERRSHWSLYAFPHPDLSRDPKKNEPIVEGGLYLIEGS